MLITGGNQGLGAAYKEAFENLGAQVYVASRKKNKETFYWDMSEEDSTKKLMENLESQNISIDILIHCSHIFSDKKLIPQVKVDEFRTSLVNNIVPLYELTRAICRGMSRRGFGRILYVGSLISVYGGAGKVSYITEKAAMTGLARAFAADYRSKNIGVNIIHPNLFQTPDIEERVPAQIIQEMKKNSSSGELLQIKDILEVSLPLLMPENLTSGESLNIDGGIEW